MTSLALCAVFFRRCDMIGLRKTEDDARRNIQQPMEVYRKGDRRLDKLVGLQAALVAGSQKITREKKKKTGATVFIMDFVGTDNL